MVADVARYVVDGLTTGAHNGFEQLDDVSVADQPGAGRAGGGAESGYVVLERLLVRPVRGASNVGSPFREEGKKRRARARFVQKVLVGDVIEEELDVGQITFQNGPVHDHGDPRFRRAAGAS